MTKLANQNNITFALPQSSKPSALSHKDKKGRLARKKSSEDKEPLKHAFVVDVSGSYKDLGTFLSQAMDMKDIIIDVQSINLSSSKADHLRIDASINMVLLAIKDYGKK